MASFYLLRPLGSSQLIFTPSSSENRATSCSSFQRRREECVPSAFVFHCRNNHRPSSLPSAKILASPYGDDGTIVIRGNFSCTAEADTTASSSQPYHGTERFYEESSSISKGNSPTLETLTPMPARGDTFGAYGEADQKPSVPSAVVASTKNLNGSGAPRFSQMQPMEPINSMPYSQPVESMDGGARPDLQSNSYERTIIERKNLEYPPQYNDMSKTKFMDGPSSREFYAPRSGDLVLGVVTHANDLELTVEIGSKVPAVITRREFQPITEVGINAFFKLPLDIDSNETVEGFVVPPVGKVLLVGDQADHDGALAGENVEIGTVFVAEVLNSASGESRPLLTCRRLAERLTLLRIEQIMKTGEPIHMEITQCNDGGLQGSLEGLRAFLPKSELLVRPKNTAALQDYVGNTVTVSVIKLENHLSNAIVSEIKPWMSENVLLGSVHDLLVTKLFPYGLQVEILDTRVRGFIHIKSITRGFAMSVYTFFTEGDVIRGMVITGRKPGQLSFSIAALEPPDEDGLVLKQRERVYDGADEVAKNSPEYQLPLEQRRIFARPSSPTSVNFQDKFANLPWLHLEKLRYPS